MGRESNLFRRLFLQDTSSIMHSFSYCVKLMEATMGEYLNRSLL